jgi:hypothetical protein
MLDLLQMLNSCRVGTLPALNLDGTINFIYVYVTIEVALAGMG